MDQELLEMLTMVKDWPVGIQLAAALVLGWVIGARVKKKDSPPS
jgi:hypothetical protein